MQPADAPSATGGTSAEAAERFTARGTSGRVVVIEKLRAGARENSLQGLEWSDGGPRYQLQGGGAVERMDESTYRIVSTGEEVRREEGQHGEQHRIQPPTPTR
jgi:hypothetical protein